MSKKLIIDALAAGAKVLDVRTPQEFQGVHFPNAINIPVQLLQSRLAEVGDKNAPVVVYCQSGGRSAMAATMLRSAGYKQVLDAGGVAAMMSYEK